MDLEFKGTKGEFTMCEHSWSDTSIIAGGKTIATNSIYDDATEDNQEELETEMLSNFKLMCASKDLLNALQTYLDAGCKEQRKVASIIAKKAIEKALK